MDAYVGSMAWCRETSGVLRLRDKAELVRLAGLLGSQLPRYTLSRWTRPPEPSADLPDLADLPGVAATAHDQLVTCGAPRYLRHHSIRTYWLSRFIGEAVGADFDDELLALASLAHDVGLLDIPGPQTQSYPCFSIRSAHWAMGIARDAGWDAARVDTLGEAITLNLNGVVPRRHGVTARLMMLGVLADVTGIYRWRADPAKVRTLYRELPVLDQQPKLTDLFVSEANRHVHCRGHFAVHRLGFALLMRHAPQVVP
jgi:hypothetical protein